MNKFIMLVGLPGSGKDTWMENFIKNEENKYVVLSSDNIREELYGDAAEQGDPQKVFSLMHKRLKYAINRGENIIYNATNITSKNRRQAMSLIKDNKDYMRYAIIIATPYKQCLLNNKERAENGGRFVPEEVVKRMYYSYEPPHYFEGFNKIEVYYPFIKPYLNISEELKRLKKVPHDNPHHSFSIGTHMDAAAKKCKKDIKSKKFSLGLDENDNYKDYYNDTLIKVLSMHDIGKEKTKAFTNYKNEPTEIAHYYNHQNVGAYEYMFYMNDIKGYNPIKDIFDCNVAAGICYHMKPFEWKKGNTEKLRDKYKQLWGFRLFNLIEAVHKYDTEAH